MSPEGGRPSDGGSGNCSDDDCIIGINKCETVSVAMTVKAMVLKHQTSAQCVNEKSEMHIMKGQSNFVFVIMAHPPKVNNHFVIRRSIHYVNTGQVHLWFP